ncbi:tetratricopeptide repeat protein [Sphingomonas sp. RS2018]
MLYFQLKLCTISRRLGRGAIVAAVIATTLTGCSDKTQKALAEAQTAQNLLDAGNLPAARNAVARALALRDDQLDIILLDGRIKYQMGDAGAAFDAYNLALAIDPNNAEALQAVSQIGASIGNEADSRMATDRILAGNPGNIPALLVRGVQALNRRDFAAAEKAADRMRESDPKSEPGLVLKARTMSQTGRAAEALALLREAAKENGATRMIATALLENARDAGDLTLMREQYARLAELVPNNIDLTLDEANIAYKTGDRDGARGLGWSLLTKNGTSDEAVTRLIDLWEEYDPRPLDDTQVTTLVNDGPPAARLAVARYYLTAGDARTASTLTADLPGEEANGLRARIADAGGDAGALPAAEAVLARDQTNCDALAVRANGALRRNRPTEAVVAAQRMASECLGGDGYELLARSYAARNDDIAVRRAFLEGIRVQPLSTPIVARYASWLAANGAVGEAADVARRLTQRAPAKVSGWRLLQVACARASRASCVAEAKAGEATARRTYAIDLPPGQRRANPLLGNSWR